MQVNLALMLMKSRSPQNDMKKGFMIFLTVTLRPFTQHPYNNRRYKIIVKMVWTLMQVN